MKVETVHSKACWNSQELPRDVDLAHVVVAVRKRSQYLAKKGTVEESHSRIQLAQGVWQQRRMSIGERSIWEVFQDLFVGRFATRRPDFVALL